MRRLVQKINDDVHVVDSETFESECGLNISGMPLKRYLWPAQITCKMCVKILISQFGQPTAEE